MCTHRDVDLWARVLQAGATAAAQQELSPKEMSLLLWNARQTGKLVRKKRSGRHREVDRAGLESHVSEKLSSSSSSDEESRIERRDSSGDELRSSSSSDEESSMSSSIEESSSNKVSSSGLEMGSNLDDVHGEQEEGVLDSDDSSSSDADGSIDEHSAHNSQQEVDVEDKERSEQQDTSSLAHRPLSYQEALQALVDALPGMVHGMDLKLSVSICNLLTKGMRQLLLLIASLSSWCLHVFTH